MAKYQIGNRTFEAKDLGEAVDHVLAKGWTGKLLRVDEKQPVTDDRSVKVTCGWGKNFHLWETTVADAVKYRNCCPDHRG